MVEQLFEHRWPSGTDVPLAMIVGRIDDLANRLPIDVQTWEVDGLGPMRGCLLRLPSGRVILLAESEHSIQHFGAKGPSVDVDAADAVERGLADFTEEVRAALNLSLEEILPIWDNPDAWRAQAASAVESVKDYRARKSFHD